MATTHGDARNELRSIARAAMLENAMLPDFSRAVLDETDAITRAATADASVRDQRALLWCSIDNDDSRDLDQLSVAEALPGGAVKVLVAVAGLKHCHRTGVAGAGRAPAVEAVDDQDASVSYPDQLGIRDADPGPAR